LKATGLSLRVVGFADDNGSPAANQAISRRRAEIAAQMLVDRGVAKDRLSLVGRAAADPIADQNAGTRERNRRAVFELLYEGEVGP